MRRPFDRWQRRSGGCDATSWTSWTRTRSGERGKREERRGGGDEGQVLIPRSYTRCSGWMADEVLVVLVVVAQDGMGEQANGRSILGTHDRTQDEGAHDDRGEQAGWRVY